MARGWESKSVEQQQDDARTESRRKRTPLSSDEIARARHRQGLELSSRRILQQLETASNPRHRQMLETALNDIEAQLTKA